jgi:hypothetical protein
VELFSCSVNGINPHGRSGAPYWPAKFRGVGVRTIDKQTYHRKATAVSPSLKANHFLEEKIAFRDSPSAGPMEHVELPKSEPANIDLQSSNVVSRCGQMLNTVRVAQYAL